MNIQIFPTGNTRGPPLRRPCPPARPQSRFPHLWRGAGDNVEARGRGEKGNGWGKRSKRREGGRVDGRGCGYFSSFGDHALRGKRRVS